MKRVLLVGCHGGVGRAVLSLLEKTEVGKDLRKNFATLFLLDQTDSPQPSSLPNVVLLPAQKITSATDLGALIREYQINQVVDLSSLDTLDCAQVCEELGVDFLCTSVEEWPRKGFIPTDEAIGRLLPPLRPDLKKQSHLVGSGANPGIVNALAFAAIRAFAEKTGVEPTQEALQLHSILITEEDSTRDRTSTYPKGTFPMTWSPEHCLEEIFEPRAFAARSDEVLDLGHRPSNKLYRARCGDRLIDGMAVPHEETRTLARYFEGLEIAFIYRIPEAARQALSLRPDKTAIQDWTTRRLCPTKTPDLQGRDRLGVLLCSRRYGEFWMGFDTSMEKALQYGTNATQLQVAAGVIAGWKQLGHKKGIHFVEDLNRKEFLEVITEILGKALTVHDAQAPTLTLRQRQVSKPTQSLRKMEAPGKHPRPEIH